MPTPDIQRESLPEQSPAQTLSTLRRKRRNQLLRVGGLIVASVVIIDVVATGTGNIWAVPIVHALASSWIPDSLFSMAGLELLGVAHKSLQIDQIRKARQDPNI